MGREGKKVSFAWPDCIEDTEEYEKGLQLLAGRQHNYNVLTMRKSGTTICCFETSDKALRAPAKAATHSKGKDAQTAECMSAPPEQQKPDVQQATKAEVTEFWSCT